jgi:hypothetical protein
MPLLNNKQPLPSSYLIVPQLVNKEREDPGLFKSPPMERTLNPLAFCLRAQFGDFSIALGKIFLHTMQQPYAF